MSVYIGPLTLSLPTTRLTGILQAAQFPALTGDVTTTAGSLVTTLATVNGNVGTFAAVTVNAKGLVTAATALTGDATTSGAALTLATVNGNVGSFGSSTSIPSFTVNAKGLITAASGNVVIAPAGTLTGTTLNSTVVSSSLTSVGTITSGTWNGTTIAIANGGTGQTTANTAFNALAPSQTSNSGKFLTTDGTNTSWATGGGGASPLTTKGDIYTYDTANARLPVGTNGQFLSADSTQTTGLKWITQTANIDGGSAGTIYLTAQVISGGSA